MLPVDGYSHQSTSIGTGYFTFCLNERLSEQLFMDRFNYAICMQNQWIQRHKSLAAIATRGKSSMGGFFGYKLHLIMNQSGDIMSTALSNELRVDIKMIKQL